MLKTLCEEKTVCVLLGYDLLFLPIKAPQLPHLRTFTDTLLLLPGDLAGFPHLYGPAGHQLQGSWEGSVLGLLHPFGKGLHRVANLNWNCLLEDDRSSVDFLL